MRRLVLICMMLLLPVQWTWAAAAAYCAHETGVAAKHMGHHEHKHQQHQADSGKSSPDGKLTVPGSLDSDCHFCHLGSVQWLAPTVAAAPPMTTAPPRFEYIAPTSSHIPSGPERPDRLLAA